jgi:hypothetical protein
VLAYDGAMVYVPNAKGRFTKMPEEAGTSGTTNGRPVAITYPSGNRINYVWAENNCFGQITPITTNPANCKGVGMNTSVLNWPPTRPATPLVDHLGRLFDSISSITTCGVASHHPSAPNAIEALFDPFRKKPFLPLPNPKPTNAICLTSPHGICEAKPRCYPIVSPG